MLTVWCFNSAKKSKNARIKIKYLISYFFLSNHSGKGMKNQSGDSVIIIYLSTNAFSVKIYRYRNELCRSSTRHRHSIKRKDIAWHFSQKQLLLTAIFLLTKHQKIFVINLQNRYIYDLLDCISLIALFKIIRTDTYFSCSSIQHFMNAAFSKRLNRKCKCANMVTD